MTSKQFKVYNITWRSFNRLKLKKKKHSNNNHTKAILKSHENISIQLSFERINFFNHNLRPINPLQGFLKEKRRVFCSSSRKTHLLSLFLLLFYLFVCLFVLLCTEHMASRLVVFKESHITTAGESTINKWQTHSGCPELPSIFFSFLTFFFCLCLLVIIYNALLLI